MCVDVTDKSKTVTKSDDEMAFEKQTKEAEKNNKNKQVCSDAKVQAKI